MDSNIYTFGRCFASFNLTSTYINKLHADLGNMKTIFASVYHYPTSRGYRSLQPSSWNRDTRNGKSARMRPDLTQQ